ncbi:MAG: TIGR04133 family radical SAM/SPASM protein [Prevotella sp.]|nr:TIGR04133 family radical SAM/SPASM protein [Prevotella sp.]
MAGNALSWRKRLGLEIERRLQKDLAVEHPLYQLFWECTLRCNLHCQHCGSDCKTVAQPDMPREDFLRVLDGIKEHTDPHKVFVIVTGGEPLLRPDLDEAGRAIYDRGFPWGIVTNGMLLTRERLDRLYHSGLHTVAMSLDGLEENHNWMRGHRESFRRADEALDALVAEKRIIFDIVTCVTEHNFQEIPQLREYLVEKGVREWRLITVFPVGRAAENPELRLTKEHFGQLMEFIKATRKEGRIKASYGCEGFLGRHEFDVRDGSFFCKAGITVGSVLNDGSISACTSIRSNYHQGNIYDDDFWDIWQNRFQVFRDRSWKKTGECADCKMWRYCEGNGMHLRDGDGRLLHCNYHQTV